MKEQKVEDLASDIFDGEEDFSQKWRDIFVVMRQKTWPSFQKLWGDLCRFV